MRFLSLRRSASGIKECRTVTCLWLFRSTSLGFIGQFVVYCIKDLVITEANGGFVTAPNRAHFADSSLVYEIPEIMRVRQIHTTVCFV
jgi:hypothetical protein